MSITITVNSSPFAGQEGKKVTSNIIRERLIAESETNVAITFKENEKKDSFEIGGRGELQLGVLIETMRREGFELSVSRPRVLIREENSTKYEPMEEVTIDLDEEFSSSVINSMNKRKAEMIEMKTSNSAKTRIIFKAPSRGLIGYQSKFLTETKGTGVMNRVFHSYEVFKGEILEKKNGSLISTETGPAVAYAIFNLQDRGVMYIEPQTKVYSGMIVGEHNKDNDLEINVLKGKQLTNVRASGTDKAIILVPPLKMSLEEMISNIKDDELLEVTPQNLRLRKKYLDSNERKRMKS
jgi:GTP-binding protein